MIINKKIQGVELMARICLDCTHNCVCTFKQEAVLLEKSVDNSILDANSNGYGIFKTELSCKHKIYKRVNEASVFTTRGFPMGGKKDV